LFTGLVTLYLLIETILSFLGQPIGAGCTPGSQEGLVTWHFSSIMWLDIIQSLLMVVLACWSWRIKSKPKNMYEELSKDTSIDEFRDEK
jgi:hypothetical protein